MEREKYYRRAADHTLPQFYLLLFLTANGLLTDCWLTAWSRLGKLKLDGKPFCPFGTTILHRYHCMR